MNTKLHTHRRTTAAGTLLLLALAPITACGTENAEAPEQSIGGAIRNEPKSGAFGSELNLENRPEDKPGPAYGGSVPLAVESPTGKSG